MGKRCLSICRLQRLPKKIKLLAEYTSQTRLTKMKTMNCTCRLVGYTLLFLPAILLQQTLYMISFSFRDIQDDLTFLLEEDFSYINLHCELCNTEQLLTSLGLFAYKMGSLPDCNDELSQYGPENFNSRITEGKGRKARRLLWKSITSRLLHFLVSTP